MKTCAVGIIAILIIIVFSSGCVEEKSYQEEFLDQKENGSHIFTTETRDVTGLNFIVFADDYFTTNLIIDQGNKDSITIMAEDNVIPHIKTEYITENTTEPGFIIDYDFNMPKPTKPINIHITCEELRKLAFDMKGNITINNIKSNNLDMSIEIANCSLNNVKADKLKISLNGWANMRANGQVDTQEVKTYGKCIYQADGLKSRIATVVVEKDGKATVNVKELLNAKIIGFGEIYYLGNPQVKQSTLLRKIARIT